MRIKGLFLFVLLALVSVKASADQLSLSNQVIHSWCDITDFCAFASGTVTGGFTTVGNTNASAGVVFTNGTTVLVGTNLPSGGGGSGGGGTTNFSILFIGGVLDSVINTGGLTNLTASGVGLQTTTYFDKACTALVQANLDYSIITSNGISIGGGFRLIDSFNTTWRDFAITGNTSNGQNLVAHLMMPVSIPGRTTDTFRVQAEINNNATITFYSGAMIMGQQLGN